MIEVECKSLIEKCRNLLKLKSMQNFLISQRKHIKHQHKPYPNCNKDTAQIDEKEERWELNLREAVDQYDQHLNFTADQKA